MRLLFFLFFIAFKTQDSGGRGCVCFVFNCTFYFGGREVYRPLSISWRGPGPLGKAGLPARSSRCPWLLPAVCPIHIQHCNLLAPRFEPVASAGRSPETGLSLSFLAWRSLRRLHVFGASRASHHVSFIFLALLSRLLY